MFFTKFFEKNKVHPIPSHFSGNKITTHPLQHTDCNLTLNISPEITHKLFNTINGNIAKDISKFGKSVMNPSMLADISRMHYYINNKKISVPGNEIKSKLNLSAQILEPQNEWIQEHIGSLSSFLHQGIFPDFFGAVDDWKASDSTKWKIAMVSLDRNKTDTRFYISSNGMIRLITQANITNIILRNNDILMVDKNRSIFTLQLSFRAVKMPDRCIITTQGNEADGSQMVLHGIERLK